MKKNSKIHLTWTRGSIKYQLVEIIWKNSYFNRYFFNGWHVKFKYDK